MITFEEATSKIREFTEGDSIILYGFKYKDYYVFDILDKNYKEQYSDQVYTLAVKISTGNIGFLNKSMLFDDMENYHAAREKKIDVDGIPDDLLKA